MPQHHIRFEEIVPAAPETVFEFFADHEQFITLFGGRCTRIKQGEAEPNGLGSVRRIGPGPLAFEETIVAFERPRQIHYAISRGGPLKNHLGRIEFSPAPNGGTRVNYQIEFDGKLPLIGHAVKTGLQAAWQLHAHKVLAKLA